MIYRDCLTCRQQALCPAKPEHCREALFAHGRGVTPPVCRDYQPRYSRGVDGVLDVAPSPRPSHPRGVTSINHGGSAC
ncbi:hypothetical protein [Syntrophotalea acetylenica]|uniref:hypothetical protein n=1 Tax=Syntrophotalea acetylenica TaxID=29542 RepID=UPI000A951DCC|nr:hypothetical protein [Syntrophotalea acetylenica]